MFYHRVVVCHLIGHDIDVPLDVETQRPGEGEVVAAKRLLERVFNQYGRFFDAVAGDGLYLEAPFFNFCIEHGKHVVAVIKDEGRALFQDAQGLFASLPPVTWQEGNTTVDAWDEEGFNTMEGVEKPIRVLHTQEQTIKRQRIKGRWETKVEHHTWWWATTIPKSLLPSRRLWAAGHKRWDIENGAFNQLSANWALDHCFKHHPKAIVNFVLILFIAFVLVQCFHHRNLKPQLRRLLTLIGLVSQIHQSLGKQGLKPPWHEIESKRPP